MIEHQRRPGINAGGRRTPLKRPVCGLFVIGVMIMCAAPVHLFGQDTLDVIATPAGNLNMVINGDTLAGGVRAHPDRVYRLKRGKIYQLTAPMKINGNITMVPNDSAGIRPPVLVGPSSVDHFFDLVGMGSKVRMNSLYLLSQRVDNTWLGWSTGIQVGADSVHLQLRGVIFDGWSNAGIVISSSQWAKVDVQDCVFRNHQHNTSWFGGQPFFTGIPVALDTVIFLNNTFMANSAYVFSIRGYTPYALFEHNTMVFGVANPFLIRQATNLHIRNNIFYAMHAMGGNPDHVINGWFMNYPDTASSSIIRIRAHDDSSYWSKLWGAPVSGPEVHVDPDHGVTPAMLDEGHRVFDVRNNAYFWPTKLEDFYTTHNDTVTRWDLVEVPVYGGGSRQDSLKRVIVPPRWLNDYSQWTVDSLAGVRSPDVRVENNVNVDPGFPAGVADHVDALITYVHKIVTNRLDAGRWEYPSATLYPPAWPLPEDLAYSNGALMTAGTDGFPLGDLNWFPDKKAEWARRPIPIGFQNLLSVSDGCSGAGALVFGSAAGATAGLDTARGEYELPPVPPTEAFDARFGLPGSPAVFSPVDLRADTITAATWRVTFQPGTCGYPLVFSWDSTAFPAAGSVFLRDELGGTLINVNMRTRSAYTLTNSAVTSLLIVYSSDIVKDIAVDAGWNLLSVPVMAQDSSVAALYPEAASSAFGFANGYEAASRVSPGRGYWLKFAEADTVSFVGARMTVREIQVPGGWSIIGPFEEDVPVAGMTSSPGGIVSSSYFGFSSGYTVATTLQAGKGYWVKASQAGVLHVGAGAGKSAGVVASIDTSWARIIVRDSTGEERTLYVAPAEGMTGGYELPPPAPRGVFDMRYVHQTMVDTLGRSSHDVMLSSAVGPLQIRGERLRGREFSVTDGVDGRVFKGMLREGEVLVAPVALDMLRFEERGAATSGAVPTQYALDQNYPNPFNPSTVIRIALPEAVKVRLVVYNVLGQEVAELINGELAAGYHDVEFRADRLASGVYLYRVEAGHFVAVRKFVVIR